MSDNTELPNDGSPPGHIDKMLGRKPEEQPNEGETQVTPRPDNVPEKFWDAEKGAVNTDALLKAQADAEAALRRQQNGEPAPKDEAPADPDPVEPEVSEKQQPVVANASAEYAEKGELSEDTFKKLEGVGLSRDMVNAYIEGQKAVASNLKSAAYQPFEGEEGYSTAADWAAQNLSDDEIKALDVQLTSTNPAIVAQGAAALKKIYSENVDVEPRSLRGNNNGSTSGDVYSSRAEMMRDMSSPLYRTSEGFRREVMEKLGRSKL